MHFGASFGAEELLQIFLFQDNYHLTLFLIPKTLETPEKRSGCLPSLCMQINNGINFALLKQLAC